MWLYLFTFFKLPTSGSDSKVCFSILIKYECISKRSTVFLHDNVVYYSNSVLDHFLFSNFHV